VKKILLSTILLTTSFSSFADNSFDKEIEEFAARSGAEIGYVKLSGENIPYIIYKGNQITLEEFRALAERQKTLDKEISKVKKSLEGKIDKSSAEMITKHVTLDKLNSLEKHVLAQKLRLDIYSVDSSQESLNHLTFVDLTGAVKTAAHSRDSIGNTHTSDFSGLINFNESTMNDMKIVFNHKGLPLSKKNEARTYTEKTYLINEDLPKESTSLTLSVGDKVELYSEEGKRYIVELKSNN